VSLPFLDTNILVYAFGYADPRKPIAEDLLLLGGTVSVQVLNEFASVARKKYQMSWDSIKRSIEQTRVCCPEPRTITLSTHWAALRLCEQYRVGIYDGLILASALEGGCDFLYTEDLQHSQTIEGLRIVNPFL
jgi:predicted nucleic acid-binding protein